MKRGSLLGLTLFISISLFATTYYVKPDGNDNLDGKSLENAFRTPNKACSTAVAGDIIWVKGGEYLLDAGISFTKDGTVNNYIKMWAVAGERPIFNCQPLIDAGKTSNSGRGMQCTRSYWHIKGITLCNTNDRGITIGSSSTKVYGVILEGLEIYHANNDGICFTGGSGGNGAYDCLVLNCDSHHNWERNTDGNNGDGFSAKAGGTGNVFRGCRAWNNSDDGWDTYGNVNPVLFDSCWAFCNGYNVFGYTGTWAGNGNGFKLGAAGNDNGENIVVNSVAFGNRTKGFDQNHNIKGLTVINCTGYMNFGANGNFAFQDLPTAGTLMKHVMKNNLSIPYNTTVLKSLAAGTEEVTNSWNLSITISASDFITLDTSLARAPRKSDYTLQNTGLFRLKSTSPAIESGSIVSYTFNGNTYNIGFSGTTCDLGAYEYSNSGSGSTTATLVLNAGSTSQTVSANSAIAPITYNYTNALSVVGSGLPSGVSCFSLNGVANVSGVPTVAGTYNYTVTTIGADVNASMQGTITVTAQQAASYSLTVSATNGSITKSPDKASYSINETITLTATAANGYTFSGWSGDLSGSQNPATITMNGNKNITAVFVSSTNSFKLTLFCIDGSITKTPDKNAFGIDETVALTATPNPGFRFIGWSGDVTGTINPINLTVNKDKIVYATFEAITSISGTENNMGYLEVFPTQARSDVVIQYSLPGNNSVSLDIYSITGKKTGALLNSNNHKSEILTHQFNVSGLENGQYFVILQSGNRRWVQRFQIAK